LSRTDDVVAIIQVVNRYALAVDAQDWVSFRRLFVPDVTAIYEGSRTWTDLDTWVDDFTQIHKQYDATQHLISNHVVDVDGDSARAISYGHIQYFISDEGLREIYNYYDDDFVRVDGEWKLSRLRCRTLWRSQSSLPQLGTPLSQRG
jgi:hypothetical protein